MGKSPGKWIKTILFGKKHSKSNLSKNVVPDKKVALKTTVEDQSGNSPVISDPCHLSETGIQNLEIEKGISGSPGDAIDLSPVNQIVNSQSNNTSLLGDDAEMRRQEQAATVAQAAFRGYLARRAFRALKGIIRLQALIRGHLARRQAVTTLRCMQAIVKLQALARGQKVNVGVYSSSRSQKLTKNIFARKLLAKMPTAMPLSLQYDLTESNSAWNWLERWSASHFWEPPIQSKKTSKAKPQRKQGTAEAVEFPVGKSRRTFRKVSTATNGENSVLASSEMDKPKNNLRKAASNQPESVQEQPQNELERVKRNLRKITSSTAEASEKTGTETEKSLQPHQSVEAVNNSDVSGQAVVFTSEKQPDSDVAVDKMDPPEAPSNMAVDESLEAAKDNPSVVDAHSLENGVKMETALTLDDELSCKEEKSGRENNKVRKRRSLPTKQESPENVSQNSPSLPSYMAATESAKAKLRASGSPKLPEDGAEYGFTRRHSLPASTNGKLSSSSPRIQKPQANGKGGSKTNKSLVSSRDDKAVQPGWRR